MYELFPPASTSSPRFAIGFSAGSPGRLAPTPGASPGGLGGRLAACFAPRPGGLLGLGRAGALRRRCSPFPSDLLSVGLPARRSRCARRGLGPLAENAVDLGGDLVDRGHAVDRLQRPMVLVI